TCALPIYISFPANTADICATPGGAAVFGGSATPVQLSAVDRIRSNEVYNHWGQSIDAYEQSLQVSAFSSKFDAFLKGKYTLTACGPRHLIVPVCRSRRRPQPLHGLRRGRQYWLGSCYQTSPCPLLIHKAPGT